MRSQLNFLKTITQLNGRSTTCNSLGIVRCWVQVIFAVRTWGRPPSLKMKIMCHDENDITLVSMLYLHNATNNYYIHLSIYLYLNICTYILLYRTINYYILGKHVFCSLAIYVEWIVSSQVTHSPYIYVFSCSFFDQSQYVDGQVHIYIYIMHLSITYMYICVGDHTHTHP